MTSFYLNYPFPYAQYDSFKDIASHSSSEYDVGSMNESLFINFFDKNTNEMTNDEKNKELENKIENSIKDVEISNTTEKKSLGRKRNGESKQNSNHTRYSDDNSRRKAKRLTISSLHDFINEKIEDIYEDDIGEGMLKKRLMKLKQNQIADASIEFNLKFLNKTLKEIFSENVTGRITNFSPERNKEIIEELINEKDEEKRKYFQGLFNIKFIDCLKYFRGDEDSNNEYLRGLKKFSEMEEALIEKEGKDYVAHIKRYLKKFEEILYNKKPRKSKKGKQKMK